MRLWTRLYSMGVRENVYMCLTIKCPCFGRWTCRHCFIHQFVFLLCTGIWLLKESIEWWGGGGSLGLDIEGPGIRSPDQLKARKFFYFFTIFFCIMQWDEKDWTPNSSQMCIFGHPIQKSWLKPCFLAGASVLKLHFSCEILIWHTTEITQNFCWSPSANTLPHCVHQQLNCIIFTHVKWSWSVPRLLCRRQIGLISLTML